MKTLVLVGLGTALAGAIVGDMHVTACALLIAVTNGVIVMLREE